MWDCDSAPCQKVIDLIKEGKAILVCPEQLGGLSTPRIPAEQKGEGVTRKDGVNVTSEFKRGAEEALKIAKLAGCNEAILKSKSPSCGCGKVYDGTFSGRLIDGDGVFCKLLKENGFKVLTDRIFDFPFNPKPYKLDFS